MKALAALFTILGFVVFSGEDIDCHRAKPAKPSVPYPIKGPGDTNRTVCAQSAAALAYLGSEAQEALPRLVVAMNEGDTAVRLLNGDSSTKLAPARTEPLLAKLGDENPTVRLLATRTLGRIRPVPKGVVSALSNTTTDNNPAVPEGAGSDPKEVKDERAVAALIAVLRTEQDPDDRTRAIVKIGALGPKAKAAIPILIEILKSPSSYPNGWLSLGSGRATSGVPSLVAQTLVKIGPASVPPLVDVFRSSRCSKQARLTAVWTLTLMKPAEAVPAIPSLLRILKDPDKEIREKALWVFEVIGPRARVAIPSIRKALNDPSSRVRLSAARALYQVDPRNQATIPALIKCLKDRDSWTRCGAATALGSIGSKAAPAVAALTEALQEEDSDIRRAVASALGWIGPKAKQSIPALQKVAKHDPEQAVREEAAEAIKRIQAKKKH
jgi:HEAT repeat protein